MCSVPHLAHHHLYSFSLLQGMVIHNMECNKDFTHLSSEIWATAAGDALASGDKLPSDHTSKTDVRGQCDNSSTGNVLRPPLQRVREGFNSCAPRIWRIYSSFVYMYILFFFFKKREKRKKFCCLLRSVASSSYGMHRLSLAHTAVTVSRIEQMSPLKAFFSRTHGLYYHHEIKLKTCPFRRHNDRVILGR